MKSRFDLWHAPYQRSPSGEIISTASLTGMAPGFFGISPQFDRRPSGDNTAMPFIS